MKIGIASPISSFVLRDFLYKKSRDIASTLSNHDAPAVSNLALTFLKKGHSLIIFTKDSEAKRFYKLKGERLTIYVIPFYGKGIWKLWTRTHIVDVFLILRMFFSKETFDVLSVHWTRDYAIGARRWLGKCPITCTVRDIIPAIKKMQAIDKIVQYENELTMNSDRYYFIANSEYTNAMIQHFWKKKSKIIYNGLSELFLDYQPKEKYQNFTFVTISTAIDGRKNIQKLLEAYISIHKKYPKTNLILLGPPFIDENAYVKGWKDLGLLEGVSLVGSKTRIEIKEILTSSHCLVHPSVEETFGNILVEAMSCKCLCIGGQDSGAVPYVLKQGRCGILCDVLNSNSITHALENAIINDNTQIIEEAFVAAHNEYSPDNIANSYLSLFENLIAHYDKNIN